MNNPYGEVLEIQKITHSEIIIESLLSRVEKIEAYLIDKDVYTVEELQARLDNLREGVLCLHKQSSDMLHITLEGYYKILEYRKEYFDKNGQFPD